MAANGELSKEIIVEEYPILQELCWSYHSPTIGQLEALHRYEDGWSRIDKARLTARERALIDRLIETVGNGCFLG